MRGVGFQGAEAFFRMLRSLPSRGSRRRARRRAGRLLGRLARRSVEPPHHRLVRQVFFRALGGTYLIAFTSLGRQVRGLYGSRGILPVHDILSSPRLAALGRERYLQVPSLFWLDASDETLVRGLRAGQVLALAVMLGLAPQAALTGLWALYLSYVSTGREFVLSVSTIASTPLSRPRLTIIGLAPAVTFLRPSVTSA